MNLVQETRVFSDALNRLPLPAGVSHVYNPLAYMRRAHERYLERFVPCMYEQVAPRTILTTAPSPRPYLILGMNPGPWGMVQTGVPFGDVATARSLLLYDTPPEPELERVKLHPNRPVLGLASARREASGERLWGGLSQVWAGGPADVLRDAFAMNYCPLAYFAGDEQGTNVTPDAFAKSGPYRDREYAKALDVLCSKYLKQIIEAMDTRVVLAVGRYAEFKARMVQAALRASSTRPKLQVVYLTHPSPLVTRSAEQWAEMAQSTMKAAGVLPGRFS